MESIPPEVEEELRRVDEFYKEMKRRQIASAQARRTAQKFALIAATIGLLASVALVYSLSYQERKRDEEGVKLQYEALLDKIAKGNNANTHPNLGSTTADFRKTIGSGKAIPADNRERDDEKVRIDELEKRLGSLEASIQKSPESVLSVPMMRKDIDSINDKIKESKDDQNSEISRIYTWLYGIATGILTLCITIIGTAATGLVKKNSD